MEEASVAVGVGWDGLFGSLAGEAIGDDVDDGDDDSGGSGGGDCEREVFGGEIGRGVFFSGLLPQP